jgi:hypothetical protein
MNTNRHETRLSRKLREVLDCGSPLPLWECWFAGEKRQRTGALQDAGALSQARLEKFFMRNTTMKGCAFLTRFSEAMGEAVAQICNLLYRRIAFGRPLKVPRHRSFLAGADCKSAIQQIANLRYVVAASPRWVNPCSSVVK